MSESLEDMCEKIGKLVDADDPTALEEALRLTEQYPMELQAWTKLAFVHSMLDQYDEAIAAMTYALEIAPAQPELYLKRGSYELDRDNFEAALADFTAGIALCHEHQNTYDLQSLHFYRADVLVRLRRFEEARMDLEHVPEGFKRWTTTLTTKTELLAACDGKEINWEEEATVGSLDDRIDAIRKGARIDAPKGVEVATRLAEEFPNVAKVWHCLHDAHWLNEDLAVAASVMQKAIDLEPQEPTWLYYRADTTALLGNFAASVDDLTEAIRVCDPNERATFRQKLYFFRADMFLRLGRKVEARADLEHAPDVFALRTTRIRTKEEMLAECDT